MYQYRTEYIDEVNNFITRSRNSLNSVLKTINWTKESLLPVKEVGSLLNPEKDEPVADHGITAVNETTFVEGQVYILDMHIGNPLRTISFLQHISGGGDHLYSDIVASLLVSDEPTKTDKKDVKNEDKAAALIQLLKMERDAKRRRISYKNKVHTKNKSHTEVLREVLGEQMLTITGVSVNDPAVATNERLKPSQNEAQELIAIRPPPGNPHLAWLDILEKAEGDRKQSDYHSRTEKCVNVSYNRHSAESKERYRYEEEKERKKHKKDRKRKEEDKGKHQDKERKNDWNEFDINSSPNSQDRHDKKKKKKRSRSLSPRPHVSHHHRHKSKHKKKKH